MTQPPGEQYLPPPLPGGGPGVPRTPPPGWALPIGHPLGPPRTGASGTRPDEPPGVPGPLSPTRISRQVTEASSAMPDPASTRRWPPSGMD